MIQENKTIGRSYEVILRITIIILKAHYNRTRSKASKWGRGNVFYQLKNEPKRAIGACKMVICTLQKTNNQND